MVAEADPVDIGTSALTLGLTELAVCASTSSEHTVSISVI
ncbi:hypothetical protein QFZ32_004247 [Streptomyces canus]|nr:hypothetical protein [Streptomyces canus]